MPPPGGAPPNLETVLLWLLDSWGEAQIRETLDFLTRPGAGGRPLQDDRPYLLEIARTIASAAPSRSWPTPTKKRTPWATTISRAAREVAVRTPQYKPGKNVSKTLRGKFYEILDGPPQHVSDLTMRIAILLVLIGGERCRWADLGNLPERTAILAKLDDLERGATSMSNDVQELCSHPNFNRFAFIDWITNRAWIDISEIANSGADFGK